MMETATILQEQIDYYCARAVEYDEWFYRRGRYNRSEASNNAWFHEVEQVQACLHALPEQVEILELAAGTGIWTQELIKLGHQVTVVDASAEMIAINKAKLNYSERVQYVQADLFTWKPERQYDMIFFGFWLSHVPGETLGNFLAMVSNATKLGGLVFMVDSRKAQESTAVNQTSDTVGHIQQRILNDGRTFDVVKVYYEPNYLIKEFAAVGIEVQAYTTENFFIYATGRKI